MKKQLFFLMLIAGCMLAFTGCKKDDDDADRAAKIEGRWDLIKTVSREYVDGKFNAPEEELYKIGEEYVVFEGNKISMYYDGKINDSGTFQISGDKIKTTTSDGENESTIKWNTNDQFVITSKDDDGSGSYELTESTYNRHK